MVQGSPGATQPAGVDPGVSHLLASPPGTGVVIPGANGLWLKEESPVWLAVISVIRTIVGVQVTAGFQEYGELPEAFASRDLDMVTGIMSRLETERNAKINVGT
jgi:hypothetical protein